MKRAMPRWAWAVLVIVAVSAIVGVVRHQIDDAEAKARSERLHRAEFKPSPPGDWNLQ